MGSFLEKCGRNLKAKLDAVIYYSISIGALRPPVNVTDGKEFFKK